MTSSKCSFENLSQICSVNLCDVFGMVFYQLKHPKRSTSLILPRNFSHDPRVSPYVSQDVRYVFTSLGAHQGDHQATSAASPGCDTTGTWGIGFEGSGERFGYVHFMFIYLYIYIYTVYIYIYIY